MRYVISRTEHLADTQRNNHHTSSNRARRYAPYSRRHRSASRSPSPPRRSYRSRRSRSRSRSPSPPRRSNHSNHSNHSIRSRSYSRSPSPPRRRRRSYSRSPSPTRSRSYSRSPSPIRKRNRQRTSSNGHGVVNIIVNVGSVSQASKLTLLSPPSPSQFVNMGHCTCPRYTRKKSHKDFHTTECAKCINANDTSNAIDHAKHLYKIRHDEYKSFGRAKGDGHYRCVTRLHNDIEDFHKSGKISLLKQNVDTSTHNLLKKQT